MKKSLSVFLILSLLLSTILIPAQLKAEEKEEEINNTITCEWQDNNKTLVLKGKGRLADSEWVNKVKVWYPTLEKLVISEGITSIGTGYVNEFISEKIKSLVFPEGLQVLESGVLFSCEKNIQNIKLPSTLKRIENGAITVAEGLMSLKIPDSVTYIGEDNFTYCPYLKKLTLPKSLKECKTTMVQCPALKTVVNRSSLSIPLDNCKKRKTWYVDGKKKSKVPAGETAKSKGKKYKIKYDLKGGKAKCKLPKTYRYGSDLKLPMKKISKKGYYLLAWRIEEFENSHYPYHSSIGVSTHGTVKPSPIWIKYKVKNVKGKKIKISVEGHKKVSAAGFITRYATKKDMSNAKYCPSDGFGNDLTWGRKTSKYTLKGLKKGKKYYIQIAARYSEDIGPWYGKRCVKVKK